MRSNYDGNCADGGAVEQIHFLPIHSLPREVRGHFLQSEKGEADVGLAAPPEAHEF